MSVRIEWVFTGLSGGATAVILVRKNGTRRLDLTEPIFTGRGKYDVQIAPNFFP